MIIGLEGEADAFIEQLPQVFDARYFRDGGTVTNPKAHDLALLAAVLRKEKGKRNEWAVWDIQPSTDSSPEFGQILTAGGVSMTAEELAAFDADTTYRDMLFGIRKKYEERPRFVAIDAIGWIDMFATTYYFDDIGYSIGLRDRRASETLYWLNRCVPVLLRLGHDRRMAVSLVNQCDIVVELHANEAHVVMCRPFLELAGTQIKVGSQLTVDMILDNAGLFVPAV
jgi:hypothetical protein